MSAASLHSETHILDLASVGDSLLTSTTRYTRGPGEDPTAFTDLIGIQNPSSEVVILVFLHGLGFHKETWEPTILYLFELARHACQQSSCAPTIIEAWAIDCPDHGEAATLNQTSSRVSCLSYGRAVLALLKSDLLVGPQGFRVVLVGHSAGATSLVLATAHVSESERRALAAVILIEPWMVAPEIEEEPAMRRLTHELTHGGTARRDAWNSREEASAYFKSHPAFHHWDRRVRRGYVDHGLRTLPTPAYPARETSVTLAFPRVLESEAYGDFTERQATLERMPRVSAAVSLHLVFGVQQPSIVKSMQHSICDHAGRAASVTYLPAVGHAAPQQSPALVARTIWQIVTVLDSNAREGPVFQGKL